MMISPFSTLPPEIVQKTTERVHDRTGVGPAGQAVWICMLCMLVSLAGVVITKNSAEPVYWTEELIISIGSIYLWVSVIQFLSQKIQSLSFLMLRSKWIVAYFMFQVNLYFSWNDGKPTSIAYYFIWMLVPMAAGLFASKKEKKDQADLLEKEQLGNAIKGPDPLFKEWSSETRLCAFLGIIGINCSNVVTADFAYTAWLIIFSNFLLMLVFWMLACVIHPPTKRKKVNAFVPAEAI